MVMKPTGREDGSGSATVLVCIWCRDILILMKTPSDILDGAYAYIFVIFLGIPLMVLYNQTSAIMRSLGDSRSPLIFLGISSILNIVLDLALVRPMGVAGTRLRSGAENDILLHPF